MYKNEKGITLIALIITIIVMLILVGVTVSIAINGGLFANAKQAKTDTQNAINAENELSEGKVNIDNKIYNSIDEYIDNKTIIKETGEIQKAINISDYGKKVTNFKSKIDDTLVWRVFYEDNNNVYLISETSDGNYPVEKFIFFDRTFNADTETYTYTNKEIINNYQNGAEVSNQGKDLMQLAKENNLFTENNKNYNIMATAYLCDTSSNGPWYKYTDAEGKAAWAMGGPTIELLIASYNATQSAKVELTINTTGYILEVSPELTTDMNGGIYRLKNTEDWWIASPSKTGIDGICAVRDSNGEISSYGGYAYCFARPIVCIPKTDFDGFKLQ